jgi:hypothetical protein
VGSPAAVASPSPTPADNALLRKCRILTQL